MPVHLLTREAMELYRSRLTSNGVIVMNITNRNIALTDAVAASARAAGLRAIHKRDPATPDFNTTFHARAEIAVLAKREEDFGALTAEKDWTAGARSELPHLDGRALPYRRRDLEGLALKALLKARSPTR